LLLLNGPNRMKGYLGEPRRPRTSCATAGTSPATSPRSTTPASSHHRSLSRFSKIGGEMVPHMKVEQQIQELLDRTSRAWSRPSRTRQGERLVAFYTDPSVTSQTLWEQLCRTELPRLWLPKRETFVARRDPTLGTGKVDLRAVRQLANDSDRSGELM
jgi:acyl-[acyl-carrier-protein]-phospholipid O-acyltransferase/long-chain-fatty-acid--[acyl-carrier-protein] ligase